MREKPVTRGYLQNSDIATRIPFDLWESFDPELRVHNLRVFFWQVTCVYLQITCTCGVPYDDGSIEYGCQQTLILVAE